MKIILKFDGLPPRGPGFDPRPVYVGFMVDKVSLGQIFLQVHLFSPVIIILPMLYTPSPVTDDV